MMENHPAHAFGVDDIAGPLLALRQIVFSVWVSLNSRSGSILVSAEVSGPEQSAETGPERGRRTAYAALPEGHARFETPTRESRTSQTQRAPTHSRSHTSQCPSHGNWASISDSVRV